MATDSLQSYRSANRSISSVDPARDEQPANLLRVSAGLLWDNLAGLFLLNLVGAVAIGFAVALGLVLGFLPLVVLLGLTVYPVLAGLMGSVAGELWHDPASFPRRFGSTVRSRGWASATLGLFANGFVAAYLVTTARVLDGTARDAELAIWLAQGAFLVLLLALLTYALPLIAIYGASPRDALRNGLILAARAPLATSGMIFLLVALGISLLWIGLGMWLVCPLVAAVFLATNCNQQVEQCRTARSDRQ